MKLKNKKLYCCDMRGMLSFLILFLLSRRSMNGQEIASELEKRRGERPSPGTIYPALKNLKKENLIKEEREGKTIAYILTNAGRRSLKIAKRKFCKTFVDVF